MPKAPGFAAILTKSSWPPTGDQANSFAIQADLDLVRIFHAAHQIEGIAPQPDLDDVLAVNREVVVNQNSAAGAER